MWEIWIWGDIFGEFLCENFLSFNFLGSSTVGLIGKMCQIFFRIIGREQHLYIGYRGVVYFLLAFTLLYVEKFRGFYYLYRWKNLVWK